MLADRTRTSRSGSNCASCGRELPQISCVLCGFSFSLVQQSVTLLTASSASLAGVVDAFIYLSVVGIKMSSGLVYLDNFRQLFCMQQEQQTFEDLILALNT